MAKNSLGKRPCAICRKWFKPDVRQKGRQKTCGKPDCIKEQHRRQCKKWNKKNREYFKDNYLSKKIEIAKNKQPEASKTDTTFHKQILQKRQIKPVLPCDIIIDEYGWNKKPDHYPIPGLSNHESNSLQGCRIHIKKCRFKPLLTRLIVLEFKRHG